MIPWSKLPQELQKSILVMVIMSGGTATTACCPIICDPAPPPPSTPRVTPTMTPMIFDPPPPPAITQSPIPSYSITPMLCDPAPPPSLTRQFQATETPSAIQRFHLISVHVSSDVTVLGSNVVGRIVDQSGAPMENVQVSADIGGTLVEAITGTGGNFLLHLQAPGSYIISAGADKQNSFPLILKPNDVAEVEWQAALTEPHTMLPLAEIRTVRLAWNEGLTFKASSPWSGAQFRWSASGGALNGQGEEVMWRPPSLPGRYLLQVVADWGRTALAVDSLILVLDKDGSVSRA